MFKHLYEIQLTYIQISNDQRLHIHTLHVHQSRHTALQIRHIHHDIRRTHRQILSRRHTRHDLSHRQQLP